MIFVHDVCIDFVDRNHGSSQGSVLDYRVGFFVLCLVFYFDRIAY